MGQYQSSLLKLESETPKSNLTLRGKDSTYIAQGTAELFALSILN